MESRSLDCGKSGLMALDRTIDLVRTSLITISNAGQLQIRWLMKYLRTRALGVTPIGRDLPTHFPQWQSHNAKKEERP